MDLRKFLLRGGLAGFDEGLGAAEVGEEVAELLFVEGFEQAFGHEGGTGGFHFGDLVAGENEVLAIEAAEDDDLIILIREEAGEGAAIFSFDEEVFVAFPDFGAGLHDVEEHGFEVVAAIAGEVGADLAAFTEESVAGGAGEVVVLVAFEGVAGTGLDERGVAGDFLVEEVAGEGLFVAPDLGDARSEGLEGAQFLDDFSGDVLRAELGLLDGGEEFGSPRGA